MFFSPGYGEYCLNYGYFFKPFVDSGISVFAFDKRGFGKSEGPRGEIKDHLLDDNWRFIELVME